MDAIVVRQGGAEVIGAPSDNVWPIPEARLVTPGAIESPIVSLDLWSVIGKGARIIGSGGAGVTREDFVRLIDTAANGDVAPAIDRELPLADAAEAHRLIEARQLFGKIVLRT